MVAAMRSAKTAEPRSGFKWSSDRLDDDGLYGQAMSKTSSPMVMLSVPMDAAPSVLKPMAMLGETNTEVFYEAKRTPYIPRTAKRSNGPSRSRPASIT